MDDYYRILDVSPDAPRDEIKAAYRARRSELEAGKSDSARAEASRLNRAWNVLSDPTQRESYDARLARARAEAEIDDGDSSSPEVGPLVAARKGGSVERPRRRRLFEPADRDAPPPRPTIEIPAGMRLADSRPRLWAMAIDFVGLVVIFVAVLMYIAPALQEQRYPAQYDRLNVLKDAYDSAQATADKADATADDAQAASDDAKAANADDAAEKADVAKNARAKSDAANAEVDRLKEQSDDVWSEVRGFAFLLQEGAFVLALLYLVVPSAREGQTLGKRLRGVRAVRETGGPLGWSGSLVRYGVIIFPLNALWFIAGPLALAVVLFFVLGWMRNPNRQGMHDRFAKTIVVAAD